MNQHKAKNRNMRRVVYALGKRSGVPAEIYYEVLSDLDEETGEQTATLNKVELKRFVTYGVKHKDVMFARAEVNTQVGDRWGIILRSELPSDFELTTEHWLVHDGKRYSIISILELDADIGYHVVMRKTTGHKLRQELDLRVESNVFVSQELGTE